MVSGPVIFKIVGGDWQSAKDCRQIELAVACQITLACPMDRFTGRRLEHFLSHVEQHSVGVGRWRS